jgi:hypothetical protein
LIIALDYAPVVTGIFALAGSLIGVFVAFWLARKARDEERRSWLKDQRQEVYPKFIAAAQSVLEACEALSELDESGESDQLDQLDESDEPRSAILDRLRRGYRDLVVHNAVIQTLGSRDTIREARRHMYTLIALIPVCAGRRSDPKVDEFFWGARKSRQQALIAMRRELDVPDTDGLGDDLALPIEPLRCQAPESNT